MQNQSIRVFHRMFALVCSLSREAMRKDYRFLTSTGRLLRTLEKQQAGPRKQTRHQEGIHSSVLTDLCAVSTT